MDVGLNVKGADGFVLDGHSSIGKISRDPTDLVAQTIGRCINIPTALRCSSAPCSRRERPRRAGAGLYPQARRHRHHSAPQLGKLVNRMRNSDECEPWTSVSAS
jgi:fumarylacetoacetate (FAA) hydrolase family protein